jgi:hypothetical protein
LIYVFLLPLGIFYPLFCPSWRTEKTMDKRYQGVIRRRKSMKERKIKWTKDTWYLRFTASDYPCGIYLRFTASDYPFGILDLRLLITLWYLRFTASHYTFGILDLRPKGNQKP